MQPLMIATASLGVACAWTGSALAATVASLCTGSGTLLCSIDQTVDPTALCNDGSTPKFWYHAGAKTNPDWLVWLEGGSDCYDQASCKSRSPTYLTSIGFKAGNGSGITSHSSTGNPALYNAGIVFVHYCSSDDWSGQRAAVGKFDPAAAPASWNFQGRAIAKAVVATLNEIFPRTFAVTSGKIVLGGDSAGGWGITLTANDLLPYLSTKAIPLLVNDAGFTLNIGQYDASGQSPYIYSGMPNSFETYVQTRLAFYLGHGDTPCSNTATTDQQKINCYDSGYLLTHNNIAIPTFVSESQLDEVQLALEFCDGIGKCPLPTSPATPKGVYATAFAKKMASLVSHAQTQVGYAGFTPDQYQHVLLKIGSFTTQFSFPNSQMISPQTAFDMWFANPATRSVYVGNAPGVN